MNTSSVDLPKWYNIGDIRIKDSSTYIWADNGTWLEEGSLASRKKFPTLYSIIGHMYSDEDLRCCTAELFVVGPGVT